MLCSFAVGCEDSEDTGFCPLRIMWCAPEQRLPRLFLLLLTAITLFHIVLLLDSFSLRHRDYFS